MKSDVEKETDKKKPTKKPSDDAIENEENIAEDSVEETATDAANEENEMEVDKSDNEDTESAKKGDDKEKRKKFVRLFCVHCRIESATFKVSEHCGRWPFISLRILHLFEFLSHLS